MVVCGALVVPWARPGPRVRRLAGALPVCPSAQPPRWPAWAWP